VTWNIDLPAEMARYFEETGASSVLTDDERHGQRRKVRTLAIMRPERTLPSVPRSKDPVGVYSKDFSRHGCACIASSQVYPEEIVRILLPTLWLRVLVVRGRRLGSSCYEFGGELLEQHQPSVAAFD